MSWIHTLKNIYAETLALGFFDKADHLLNNKYHKYYMNFRSQRRNVSYSFVRPALSWYYKYKKIYRSISLMKVLGKSDRVKCSSVSWAWLCTPIVWVLERLQQEKSNFEANLSYIVTSRLAQSGIHRKIQYLKKNLIIYNNIHYHIVSWPRESYLKRTRSVRCLEINLLYHPF